MSVDADMLKALMSHGNKCENGLLAITYNLAQQVKSREQAKAFGRRLSELIDTKITIDNVYLACIGLRLEILVAAGCKLKTPEAIMMLAASHSGSAIPPLIDYGINVNCKDKDGATPLLLSALPIHLEMYDCYHCYHQWENRGNGCNIEAFTILVSDPMIDLLVELPNQHQYSFDKRSTSVSELLARYSRYGNDINRRCLTLYRYQVKKMLVEQLDNYHVREPLIEIILDLLADQLPLGKDAE